MKVIVIIAVLAVLFLTMSNLNTEKDQYSIQCVAEGLILYDGIGTDLEYYNDKITFHDLNGDKVSIKNAQCVVNLL